MTNISTLKRPLAALAVAMMFSIQPLSYAQTASAAHSGVLDDGVTNYHITVPANWNGTLLINLDFNDTGAAERWLLDNGYALAGTTRSTVGWDLQLATTRLIQTLDRFNQIVRHPDRTIVWGQSRGGIVTRAALQAYPDRFDAGLPMCGGGAGTITMWNTKLDAAYALDTLIGQEIGKKLQLTGISDPAKEVSNLSGIVQHAQQTPLGRARVALAAAFAQIPGWTSPSQPEPAAKDYVAQAANQAPMLPFAMGTEFQAFMEKLSGGTFLWNDGVDYRYLLTHSGGEQRVRAMYALANADLDADLAKLQQAPRLRANPHAVSYIERYNVTWTGKLRQPVLTLHTTGDPAGPTSDETVYGEAVRRAGNQSLLRNTYVNRGGHCTFSASEKVAAVLALVERVSTGKWPSTSASSVNSLAMQLQATSPQLGTSVFVDHSAPERLRPWDVNNWDTYGKPCSSLNKQGICNTR